MAQRLIDAPEAAALRRHLRALDPATLPLAVADAGGRTWFEDEQAVRGGDSLATAHLVVPGPEPGPWRVTVAQPPLDLSAPGPLPSQLRELTLLRLTTRAVAHDLNNHLASVLLSCGLLESAGSDRLLIETIEGSTKAARELLRDLHALARRGDGADDPRPARHLPWLVVDGLRKLHELGLGSRLPVAVDVELRPTLTLDAVDLALLLTGLWAACLDEPPDGATLEVVTPEPGAATAGAVLRLSLRGWERGDLGSPEPPSWRSGFWQRPQERRLAVCDGLARRAGGRLKLAAVGNERILDLELPTG